MDYVTIAEAVVLTGKSISTIRRLVKRLADEGRVNAIKKEATIQGERYLIRRDVLFHALGLTIQPEVQLDSQATTQPDTHEQLVSILREQLQRKDEQIALLLERQRETHVLLNGYQQRLLSAPSAEAEQPPALQMPPLDPAKQPFTWVWLLIAILILIALMLFVAVRDGLIPFRLF